MYCPKCSQQQVSDDVRFCSRCGFSLGVIAHLLANNDQQLKREKQALLGAGLMMATVLQLLTFLFVFGSTTLPHLININKPVFLWIWIFFFATSLVTGGLGVINLVRSGFFKELKERDLRYQLARSEQKRQALGANAEGTVVDIKSSPRLAEPVTVTEATTRELRDTPEATSKIKIRE